MKNNEKESSLSTSQLIAIIIYLVAFVAINFISSQITSTQGATIGKTMGELRDVSQTGNVDGVLQKASSLIALLRKGAATAGTVTQISSLMSAFITLAIYKKGFYVAFVCNFISTAYIVIKIVMIGNTEAIPGVISAVVTLILITIIYLFSKKLSEKNSEIAKSYAQIVETNKVIKEKDEKLSYLAYYDILTKLPNRHMFIEKINETILNASNSPFTVLLVDIDNFKQINDAYGNQSGDVMLVTYAEKLKLFCQDSIFLGRIGGDEYGFIIQGNLTEANILNYVEKIQNIISEPIQINNTMVSSTASIGIASYPNNAVNSSDMLRCLDSAVYFAKANGKNRPCFYEQH